MTANSASVAIFQKSLQDLVKGIRSNKRDSTSFISQAIAEIKTELKSVDQYVKAEAVRKLTYLQMIGYNVSWASFGIIEVMSQPRFEHKRIGYLAANQTFNETTDVILLTTNLFKKEFAASAISSQYDIGLAINCLANIATKDLSCDCISDMVNLMAHSKSYIRKKAVLAMYKLYIKYPQGLRLTFEKLKDRIDDSDSSVVSCAVNVICELANKNPKNYLAMAPKFFKLLTTTSNNWMLIKVVKLLGSLVCEEPRLARKLLEPLATIIQNTTAKSLQYECIFTITLALPHTKRDDGTDARNVPAVVSLCTHHLKEFVENEDQNLKYLGLVGLLKLLGSHPRVVVDLRELISKCLNDDDITIRTKALELLAGIVSKKTFPDLVHQLLRHVKIAEGTYRDEIISKILYIGRKDKYTLIADFIWYVSVLLSLSRTQGSINAASFHGKDLSDQLMDITLRVESVRAFAVEGMLSMLLDGDLILGQARYTISEVLMAAAWIVGEYSIILSCIMLDKDLLSNDVDSVVDEEDGFWIEGPNGDEMRSKWRKAPVHVLVMETLLHPRATNLPARVQSAYLHAALKVFVRSCIDCSQEHLSEIISYLRTNLSIFLQSVHLEVQERASTFRYLLAELNILKIDDDNDDQHEVQPINTDLIYFPQSQRKGYTDKVINDEDELAATVAIRNRNLLVVITAEQFYTVHPKAQKKVPVPDEFNLNNAFDDLGLHQLMSIPDVANPSLSTISFVEQSTSAKQTEKIRNKQLIVSGLVGEDMPPCRGSENASTGYGDIENSEISNLSSNYNTSYAGYAAEPAYYLKNDEDDDGNITKPTVETRKKRKIKKEKSKRDKNVQAINVRDVLPAGAEDASSDSDASRNISERSMTQKSGSNKSKGSTKDETGLESIDITVPLREDEVLPIKKHRETVITGSLATNQVNMSAVSDVKKEKKRHKGSKNYKSKAKSNIEAVDNDLVGLHWEAPATQIIHSGTVDTAKEPKSPKAVFESSLESAISHRKAKHWYPFFSLSSKIDVSYSVVFHPPCSFTIYFKSISSQQFHSGELTANISILSWNINNHPLLMSGGKSLSTTLSIVKNLKPENDQQTYVTLESEFFPFCSRSFELSVRLDVFEENLIGGQESRSLSKTLKIPLCSLLVPHVLTERAFSELLTSYATRSLYVAENTIKIKYKGNKAKKVIKSILGVTNSYVVEAEEGVAYSLSAILPNQYILCTLIKSKDSAKSVSVDFKCFGSNKAVALAIVDEIMNNFSLLEF